MIIPLNSSEFKTPQERATERKKVISEIKHKMSCQKNRLKRKKRNK